MKRECIIRILMQIVVYPVEFVKKFVPGLVIDMKKTKDTKRKAVLLCTASPYKFAATVLEALGRKAEGQEQTARALEKATGKPVPQAILDLFSAEQRHFSCVEPKELDALVESFLKQS